MIGMFIVFVTPFAVAVTVMLDGPAEVPAKDVPPLDVLVEGEDVPTVDPPQAARAPTLSASNVTVR